MGRSLIISGHYRRPTGYGCHIRELVRALDKLGIRVQLADLATGSLGALPEDKRDPWFDTLKRPVSSGVILHICLPHQAKIVEGILNVNATTFETTRIPETWANLSMNQDLIILPTDSSKQAWLASGIPEEHLRLCPYGVDSNRFHPGVEPLELGRRRGRRVLEYKARFLNVSDFISVPRKNILGMLRVWIKTTSANDDAILIVKLSGYRYQWWRPDRFRQALSAIEREVGKSRRKAAPVVFYDQVLTESQMPSLYAAATHYWSMSYGEGWDFAMIEAGATGLHLIAPEHSAYTDYLDESVAQMIPSKRVPADFNGGKGLGELFAGSEWWKPDEEAAADLVRQGVKTAGAGLPTARARIANEFTWEQSAKCLVKILEELHERHGKKFGIGPTQFTGCAKP
jgi:glycosyltransferase involved in cell wall biosynthesis